MNILVACESSGTVREAFRKLGHNAWSCDLLPADDGSPYHLQMDAVDAISMQIQLRLGVACPSHRWDIVCAHPPCTHLASAGAKHFAAKRADGRQQQGIDLFMSIIHACERHAVRWAVENPIGIMSRLYRKPDQIIQPYWFGDPARKSTCLWTHGLPALTPTNIVYQGEDHITKSGRKLPKWYNIPPSNPDRWKIRSKTFQGIADAMADQWGTACISS